MQLPTNPLKAKLANPSICAGVWASFASAATVEALAYSTYDWMLIDMEHSPVDLGTLHQQLAATSAGTCHPVVRPPWCDMVTVKRLMDLGVQSFMFPMIDTPEQARDAVSFTRYPPLGVRGIAGGTRGRRRLHWPQRFGRIHGPPWRAGSPRRTGRHYRSHC